MQVKKQQIELDMKQQIGSKFRKDRGTRDQIANIHWIIKKARESQKNIYFWFIDSQSLWLCGSQQTVENSLRDGNTKPPDLPPDKSVCRLGSNS